ncbi:hypothetical protein Fmac_015333 [Flemingia macrophylla]|uniref:Uncharacterized protein n=1 Tax=Flemingia macrophylla TaxID=520843 RepID=A0ABD1MEA2_9FABA
MTTILVSVLLRNNLELMSILRLMLQTPIADHHSSRDKALDREDGSQFLAVSSRNDAIVIKGVQDVAIDTSAETRKLEGKLYAFGNMVTQLAVNQKPASVARVCGIRSSNDHLEGKLDALVILVTELGAIRSLPLLQKCAASVLPMTTILVSFLLRSNLEWMSIPRLMLQTPIADYHNGREKAILREDGSQLLAVQCKK